MKMSKRAEGGLRASIKGWETDKLIYNLSATRNNCPLCKLYNRECEGKGCGICPINRKTGEGCIGTGVSVYNYALSRRNKVRSNATKKPEYYAKKVIRFMKRLLPTDAERES